jgi:branched-chain amino acid transport system permease protein
MLFRILSGDLPRSRPLAALLLLIFLALAGAPFLFSGARALNVAATICILIVLVASYDLLLGYTGIISFAHTMFYGIGAYSVGLTLIRMGPSWSSIFIGLGIGLGISFVLALVIGLFSLRVKALFYAMVTLAIASCFAVLAAQLPQLTGGDDGLTVPVPELLTPSHQLMEATIFGANVNGKMMTYYLVFLVALAAFLFMLRIVSSPFGRVLLAIRENEFRAEAIGYRTVVYRTISNCFGAMGATLAGALLVLWLRYVGPETSLSFSIMLNVLLITFIGGMGTMYGAVIGTAIFTIAQNYLSDLMRVGSKGLVEFSAAHADSFLGSLFMVLSRLVHADRWSLWMGVLLILSVYFFPVGIVGKLRHASALKSKPATAPVT